MIGWSSARSSWQIIFDILSFLWSLSLYILIIIVVGCSGKLAVRIWMLQSWIISNLSAISRPGLYWTYTMTLGSGSPGLYVLNEVQALWPIGSFFCLVISLPIRVPIEVKYQLCSNCSFRKLWVAIGFLLQLSCRTLIYVCDAVMLLIGVLLMVLICILWGQQ